MRFLSISLLLLLATAAAVMADGGLVALGSNPYGALLNVPFIAANGQLQQAPAGSGAVSPRALAANFTCNGFTLRAVLDADSPTAQGFTCIHLAFLSGDKVNADSVVKLTPRYTFITRSLSTFGPQQITVSLDGRDVPVMVAGSYMEDKGSRQLSLSIATALQGSCTFGGKEHLVRLVSGENSLHPGLAFKAMSSGGDTLLVDAGDGTFSQNVCAFYGHPLNIDNAWYTVALNADASGFVATPFTGSLGAIEMDRDHWDAMLVGTKYLLHLSGGAGQFSVPADQYHVYLLPDSSAGNTVGLMALIDAGKNTKLCAVSAGMKTTVIPASMATSVQVNAMGSNIIFSLASQGGLGAGNVPFSVYDSYGNTLFSSAFEHG